MLLTGFGVLPGPHEHAMLYPFLLLYWLLLFLVIQKCWSLQSLGSLLFCVLIHPLTDLRQNHSFKDELLLFHALHTWRSPLRVDTRISYHPLQDSVFSFTIFVKPLFSKEKTTLYPVVSAQSQVL